MNFLTISSFTPEILLWYSFIGSVVIFLISSLILLYHWISYGADKSVIRIVEVIYFAVGVALLLMSGVSIVVFIN